MSFTIKCEKCGNEQTFNDGDKARNTHIDMQIIMAGTWEQYSVAIEMYCENEKCSNMIDLKY